jgi:release factor glutamine methyltransferase
MTDDLRELGGYDLVVSNPPYVTPTEYAHLDREVKDWESPIALVTRDSKGIEFYERIASMRHLYKPNSKLVFEIGESQGKLVKQIMETYGFDSAVYQDLAGRDRTVVGIKNL